MGACFPGNKQFSTGYLKDVHFYWEHKYYVELSGEGEAIVLLHGFTGDSSTWKQLVSVLGDSFQVIPLILLVMGLTGPQLDPSRYEMENAAQDIIDILNELGTDQAHVLGYSMGGRLALSLAVLYPERIKSLLLESASPGLKTLKKEKTVCSRTSCLQQG